MPDKIRLRLEVLNPRHSIHDFVCGDDELNDYLHDEALSDMQRDVARTFVEIDEDQPANNNVAGFFTLRAHSLVIDESYFPDWLDGVEEDGTDITPIEAPIVELMWLARDSRWEGRGVGDVLMIDALKTVQKAADCIGLIGVHLRTTPSGRRLYESYDFQQFREHPSFDGMRYVLSIKTIRAIVAVQQTTKSVQQITKRSIKDRIRRRQS